MPNKQQPPAANSPRGFAGLFNNVLLKYCFDVLQKYCRHFAEILF